MAVVWPEKFDSRPLREGYAEKIGNRLRRGQQPDAGPAKVRRRAGKRPDVFPAIWVFDSYEELREFTDWIKNTLKDGLYAFDWTHPLTGELLRIRFKEQSEDFLYTRAPFKTSLAWSVSFDLEVLP